MTPTLAAVNWPDLLVKGGLLLGWAVGVFGGVIALWDRIKQRVSVTSRWMDEVQGGPGIPSTRTTVLLVEVINRRPYPVKVTGLEFWEAGKKERSWVMPGPEVGFTYPVEVPPHDACSLTVAKALLERNNLLQRKQAVVRLSTGESYRAKHLT